MFWGPGNHYEQDVASESYYYSVDVQGNILNGLKKVLSFGPNAPIRKK